MRPRSTLVVLNLALSLTLIACSGSSTSTEGEGPTPDAGAATIGNDATPAAPASTGTDTATSTQAAGGGAADACALLTVDEVADATGQPGIEAQPVGDDETDALSACGFVSNGVLPVVITTILDPENTNADASSYLALPGSVEVPVNGARAIFMPAAGYVMAVVKGTTVVTLQVAMPADGEDFQTTATKLVQKVADRM